MHVNGIEGRATMRRFLAIIAILVCVAVVAQASVQAPPNATERAMSTVTLQANLAHYQQIVANYNAAIAECAADGAPVSYINYLTTWRNYYQVKVARYLYLISLRGL